MGQVIPASQIVGGSPGVIGVGGSGLQFTGVTLTTSWRVPTGTIASFATLAQVGAFFGLGSTEYELAGYYFAGFANSLVKPAAMLFAQYPWSAPVAPYLQGGNISGLTLAQLQAITPGDLTISINGVSHTSSSINLAGATSFSNAAATIATALGVNDASFTGVIAPETASVTGSIAGTVLTISAVGSGTLVVGGILSGTGVSTGTQILSQITGTTGGVGTYQVSISQTVASTTISETYGQLTASGSITGALAVNQVVAGSGVTAGTTITALGSGTGGTGTYIVSPSQTVGSSEAMTSGAATVTYDSTSGAFIITGGTPGTGTIGYGSGAIATSLLLTAATGAVLSQGAPIATPVAFMTALAALNSNWFSFMTEFNPVTADKVSFAEWTNSQAQVLNGKRIYWEWAEETANAQPNPTLATAQIIALGYSGTAPVYAPVTGAVQAAAAMGMIASVDFGQPNGRENFAFLSQAGLPVEVTSGTIATQLQENGFNYYGTWGTRANTFSFFYPGSITGPYNWIDSYYCAAWLEDQLQVAQMQLFTTVGQIPFTAAGAETIYNTLVGTPGTNGQSPTGPISTAIAFGAINKGVELSEEQITAVNALAGGIDVASAITAQGYYLLVNIPAPSVRATRGPWPVILFFADGGSVIALNIDPLAVQ